MRFIHANVEFQKILLVYVRTKRSFTPIPHLHCFRHDQAEKIQDSCCNVHLGAKFFELVEHQNAMVLNTILIGLLVLTSVKAQITLYNKTRCVTSFWSDRKLFDVCRTELCFIFQFESPYVFPSKKLAIEKARPFRCSSRETLYPGLGGVFFDVLNEVSEREAESVRSSVGSAYCIYSGPHCTFDDQVSFLDNAVAVGGGYQFIVGGRVMFMPNRRTDNIIQSAHIFTDSMVLMHRRKMAQNSIKVAIRNVFKPFKFGSWIVGIIFLAIIIVLVMAFAKCFWYMGENQPNILTWLINGVPGVNAEQKMAWNLLVLSFTIFVTIVLILYELAIAFSIFHRPDPLVTSFNQLASLGLDRFGVLKESASEMKFRMLVDKQQTMNDSNIPWTRMDTLVGLITALKRKRLDYIFTYELNVKFHLHSQKLCSIIAVSPLHLGAVGGWYYTTMIDSTIRTRIDKILNLLWATEALADIYTFDDVPLDCGASATQVDYSVLLVLLGLSVAPLLLLTVLSMVKAKYFPADIRRLQKIDPFSSSDTSADSPTPLT